jgi:hypothetical protein
MPVPTPHVMGSDRAKQKHHRGAVTCGHAWTHTRWHGKGGVKKEGSRNGVARPPATSAARGGGGRLQPHRQRGWKPARPRLGARSRARPWATAREGRRAHVHHHAYIIRCSGPSAFAISFSALLVRSPSVTVTGHASRTTAG